MATSTEAPAKKSLKSLKIKIPPPLPAIFPTLTIIRNDFFSNFWWPKEHKERPNRSTNNGDSDAS